MSYKIKENLFKVIKQMASSEMKKYNITLEPIGVKPPKVPNWFLPYKKRIENLENKIDEILDILKNKK